MLLHRQCCVKLQYWHTSYTISVFAFVFKKIEFKFKIACICSYIVYHSYNTWWLYATCMIITLYCKHICCVAWTVLLYNTRLYTIYKCCILLLWLKKQHVVMYVYCMCVACICSIEHLLLSSTATHSYSIIILIKSSLFALFCLLLHSFILSRATIVDN